MGQSYSVRRARPAQMHHLAGSAFADVPLQWSAEVEYKWVEQGRDQEAETRGQQIPHRSETGCRHREADLHPTGCGKRRWHSISA